MATRVTTEEIAGVRVHFDVEENGKFEATIEDYEGDQEPIIGETLAECRTKAAKVVTRLKRATAIDVTILDIQERTGPRSWMGPYETGATINGTIDCTLRGVNSRTRDLLVTIDGKKTKISDSHSMRHMARRLTPAEQDEYQSLKRAIRDAQALYTAFLERVLIDPVKATDPTAAKADE